MTDNPTPAPRPVPTRAEIDASVAATDQRMRELAERHGVLFDVMSIKYDVLLTVLFGEPDVEPRRRFDATLAATFEQRLDEAESEIRQRILMQGVRPGMRVPRQ